MNIKHLSQDYLHIHLFQAVPMEIETKAIFFTQM